MTNKPQSKNRGTRKAVSTEKPPTATGSPCTTITTSYIEHTPHGIIRHTVTKAIETK